jgi:hypothetical protein
LRGIYLGSLVYADVNGPESFAPWLDRLTRQILQHMKKSVPVEEFTQAGDPLWVDYGYRRNGTHGYIHALSLARDPAQAKVLAYTFDAIRARQPHSEFTAITEASASPDNPRDQFVVRLFADSGISLVALSQVEKFADDLRPRLN